MSLDPVFPWRIRAAWATFFLRILVAGRRGGGGSAPWNRNPAEEEGPHTGTHVQARHLPWGSGSLRVLSANQADLGIEVDVSAGDQVNLYGAPANLKVLAALFDACSADGGAAVLHRHAPEGADLVIFRGTDVPLDFPAYRRIKGSLSRLGKSASIVLQARPEVPEDRIGDLWRQANQITVRTQDHAVLLGGTGYVLRTI
jgi:hypothetical protein